MTNWTRSGGSSADILSAAVGAFVAALGGAATAAANSSAAVRDAAGLSGFLSDVERDGLRTTLDNYGLTDLVGGDPVEVMNALAARISGSDDSLDESLARDALLQVLGDMFADADTFSEMEELRVGEELLGDCLERYLVEYIFRRILQALGDRIRDNSDSPQQAARLERRVREHVAALVSLDLSTIDPLAFDWRSEQGEARIRELLADALRMAEQE